MVVQVKKRSKKTFESQEKKNEAVYIREVVEPRLEALRRGKAVTHNFDEACEEINKEFFGFEKS